MTLSLFFFMCLCNFPPLLLLFFISVVLWPKSLNQIAREDKKKKKQPIRSVVGKEVVGRKKNAGKKRGKIFG